MNNAMNNTSISSYARSESGGRNHCLRSRPVLVSLTFLLLMGFVNQHVLAQLCPCAPGEKRRGFGPFDGCPEGGNRQEITVCPIAPETVTNGFVTVQCIGGAFQVKWHPAGGGQVKDIGRCAYDWGENDGQCCIRTDPVTGDKTITRVCWWNQEGHKGHGRDPNNTENGHVHDDTNHGTCNGEYEMDCYEFVVATMNLTVIKWKRPIEMGTWLEQECWQNPSQIFDGPAPGTHADLVNLTMNGNSSEEGQDNTGNYVWARLSGIADSGSITLNIRDEAFTLNLVGGETSDEVANQLASMVNSFTPLTVEGVDAFVFPETQNDPTQLNIGRVQEQERSIQQQGQGQGQQGGIVPETPWSPPPHFSTIDLFEQNVLGDTGPIDTVALGIGVGPFHFFQVSAGQDVGGMTTQDPPAGLSIDPQTGAISGTTAVAGVFHVLCDVVDEATGQVVALLWWKIIVDDGSIPHRIEVHVINREAPFDTGPVDVSGTPGTPPFSFEPVPGGQSLGGIPTSSLPAGVSIDPDTGALSGATWASAGTVFHVLCVVTERDTWNVVEFLWWDIIIEPEPIPAMSNLGLVALLLLTAVAGVIVIRKARRGGAAA